MIKITKLTTKAFLGDYNSEDYNEMELIANIGLTPFEKVTFGNVVSNSGLIDITIENIESDDFTLKGVFYYEVTFNKNDDACLDIKREILLSAFPYVQKVLIKMTNIFGIQPIYLDPDLLISTDNYDKNEEIIKQEGDQNV